MMNEQWEWFLLLTPLTVSGREWGAGFPHQPPVLQHPGPSIELLLQFNQDAIRPRLVHSLPIRAQSHETIPTSEASHKSQVITCAADQPAINWGYP